MMQRQRSDEAQGRRRPARRRTPRLALTTVVAVLMLGAAACGSSSPNSSSYNPKTAKSDITSAFKTVFNLSSPTVTNKLTAIQNGTQIKSAFQQALSSSLAKSASGAKLDSYDILSSTKCTKASVPSPCAKVVYDILGPTGTAILPNSQGYAVYVNGKWVVAKATICGLLGLFFQASGKTGSPKGC